MSNIKCPFCQQELCQDYTGVMYCCNEDCEQSADWYGSQLLWQALIQTQKKLEESIQATLENAKAVLEIHEDLETAIKALEKLKECRFQGGEQSVKLGVRVIAQAALEQIKHKEQQQETK